jgi:hypothetical protein
MMLSEDKVQLLTAYVDGELSPRQRQAALRLLYQSSEARELLGQLQENAHKLKKLPRRRLDPAFPGEVLQAIVDRSVIPVTLVHDPIAVRLRWLAYAAGGLAAAVLFAVALGAALYVAIGVGGEGLFNPGEFIARGDNIDPPPPVTVLPRGDNRDPEEPIAPPARKPSNPLIGKVIEGVYQQYAMQIAPERDHRFTVAELGQEPVAGKFAAELKKDQALHLDVTVRNNPDALNRLKAVLKKHKIELVVDPESNTALQNAPATTELLIYAENLKPDEWSQILKELAHKDKKAAHPFGTITVASLAAHEAKQVTALLGTDPTTRVDPSATKGILNPKKGNSKNPPPKKDRIVVVLPQAPQKSASDEVRRFLVQTAQPEEGSIRVLVRIRQE